MQGLVVAVISVLALGGCQGNPATPAAAHPVPPPNTTHSDPPGKLAQIVTKPGRYTFGKDLEPGYWVGMTRSSTCNYSTTLKMFGSRALAGKLTTESGKVSFKPSPGDVLEIPKDEFFANWEDCQFWNEGDGAPPVPDGSDVPWRDVDQTTSGVDRWKMGQFGYLDAVKERVNNVDETQLTLMGLWACKVQSRGLTAETLRHFGHLTDIQADYLITMSYKHMCPEAQRS